MNNEPPEECRDDFMRKKILVAGICTLSLVVIAALPYSSRKKGLSSPKGSPMGLSVIEQSRRPAQKADEEPGQSDSGDLRVLTTTEVYRLSNRIVLSKCLS